MIALLVTVLKYPCYLPIDKEHWFQFVFEKSKIAISINKVEKGINIVDNGNSINKGEGNIFLSNPLSSFSQGHFMELKSVNKLTLEEGNDFEKLFASYDLRDKSEIFITENYYTEFVIYVEIDNFDKETFENDKKRQRYNNKLYRAFNYYIRKYNKSFKAGNIAHINTKDPELFILKQQYIILDGNKVFEHYLLRGTHFNLKPTEINNSHSIAATGFIERNKDILKENTELLEKALSQPELPEDEFLSQALEQYQLRKNFKYSFLEAFIAIESVVERFLYKKKREVNIEKKQIDDFKTEVGIGYKTNIELPLAIGFVDKEFEELLKEINKIRKLRNLVVHQGVDVEPGQAISAINIIYKFVNYLEEKSIG
jgi:uncharacterized protein YutE (UPF0331/DUF86 family)